MSAADTVGEAALYADYLVEAEKKATGQGARNAAAAIATRCKVPPNLVRGLIQPSRRPKTVDRSWWALLRAAYIAHLRRKIAELDLEITRVENLGADDGAVRDLLDDAQALARRLQELIN